MGMANYTHAKVAHPMIAVFAQPLNVSQFPLMCVAQLCATVLQATPSELHAGLLVASPPFSVCN